MEKKQAHNMISTVCASTAKRGVVATFSLHTEKSHLMRIGNNSVSLNTSETLTRLDIEVVNGRRTGTHTQMGNVSSEAYVEKALEIAERKAEVANEKDYQPILSKIEKNISEDGQYDIELETVDPAFKAEGYQKIINEVGSKYNFSGSWSSGSTELFVVSTANDMTVHHIGTDQDFNIVLKHPEKKWELKQAQSGWKKSDFCADKVIKAFKDILPTYENQDGEKLVPGEYTVAFGAQAVAEVMSMAMYTGFNGRSYEEKDAWTAGKVEGDSVLGENISFCDDPTNDKTFCFGFDQSGKERKPFTFVKNGKLQGIMYDLSTAAKYGHKPTGHEVGSISMVMEPGTDDANLLEAISGMGKVLLIPALHYLNIPNSSLGIFTGSSRFNALLIENGKVIRPIFSSRVTDSFQNVFGNTKLISKESIGINLSNTYGRRTPEAFSVPTYIVAEKVKITDSADSF